MLVLLIIVLLLFLVIILGLFLSLRHFRILCVSGNLWLFDLIYLFNRIRITALAHVL